MLDPAGHSLSFVGSGFFSCVSVFFNLVLSKVVTSEMSGLSLMVAVLRGGAQEESFRMFAAEHVVCPAVQGVA